VIVRFGEAVEQGFLPVYSVDTEQEAQSLLVMACPRNLDGEFVARELVHTQTLERLDAFGDRLEQCHKMMRKET
jgi:hypothetical protein